MADDISPTIRAILSVRSDTGNTLDYLVETPEEIGTPAPSKEYFVQATNGSTVFLVFDQPLDTPTLERTNTVDFAIAYPTLWRGLIALCVDFCFYTSEEKSKQAVSYFIRFGEKYPDTEEVGEERFEIDSAEKTKESRELLDRVLPFINPDSPYCILPRVGELEQPES